MKLTVAPLFLYVMSVYAQPLIKRSQSFSGFATFFHPKEEGGDVGACGPHEDDDSPYAALNLDQFGSEDAKSEWCNKKILIKHGNKKTVARITDSCPGCKPHSLDLTPSVFSALDLLDAGVIPISWCVIDTEGCTEDNIE